MIERLNLYYSSGSDTSNTYSNQPSKSLGGLITSAMLNYDRSKLFGNVSLTQLSGLNNVEYRCIYIKNDFKTNVIDNISFFVERPYIKTTETNPNNLTPTIGDKYLVPTGSIGYWQGYDGYIAKYDGTGWQFSMDDACTYRFCCVPLAESVMTGFYMPNGIDFVSADRFVGETTKINLSSFETMNSKGFLNVGEYFALWIERTVRNIDITSKLLQTCGIKDNQYLVISESINLQFEGDKKDGFKIDYTGGELSSFIVDTPLVFPYSVNIASIGEEGYNDLFLKFTIKWQNLVDSSKYTDAKATFKSVEYTNLAHVSDFAASNPFSETLTLNITFSDIGIYNVKVELIDSANNIVIATNSKDIEVYNI